jgi:hypothetical protein
MLPVLFLKLSNENLYFPGILSPKNTCFYAAGLPSRDGNFSGAATMVHIILLAPGPQHKLLSG